MSRGEQCRSHGNTKGYIYGMVGTGRTTDVVSCLNNVGSIASERGVDDGWVEALRCD